MTPTCNVVTGLSPCHSSILVKSCQSWSLVKHAVSLSSSLYRSPHFHFDQLPLWASHRRPGTCRTTTAGSALSSLCQDASSQQFAPASGKRYQRCVASLSELDHDMNGECRSIDGTASLIDIVPSTATFAFLNEGIDQIMNKLKLGMSYTKYMDLYTYARLITPGHRYSRRALTNTHSVAYNYCTSSKMTHGTDQALRSKLAFPPVPFTRPS